MKIIRQTAESAVQAWRAYYSNTIQLYHGIGDTLSADHSTDTAAKLNALLTANPNASLEEILRALGSPDWGKFTCSECGKHVALVAEIGQQAWNKAFVCPVCAANLFAQLTQSS